MTRLKAVLFDFDDTLYDRKADQIAFVRYICSTFSDIFQAVNSDVAVPAFLDANRIADEDYMNGDLWTRDRHSRYFLKSLGLSEDYAPVISSSYVEQIQKAKTAIPGAVSVLQTVSRHYTAALLTNGPAFSQHQRIRSMGIFGYFSQIITGPEIGMAKPDPEIFRYAADLLGVAPEECLNTGDSFLLDVAGPKNAGMQACWFNPEDLPVPEEPGVKPDYVIRSLLEIPDILEL
ncbi:MAG: HAD family hydrolase [Dehalococcoidales bacterium]|nr:HAD family hydrolase [Dehalococcoidales bacterium]